MSDDLADFWAYYATMFHRLLESFTAFGSEWSWDRRAAYLLYEATQGRTTEMAPRKGGKKAANDVAATLLTALKFLSLANTETNGVQGNHVWFQSGWGCTFDGVIALGIPIEGVDFDAFPDTKLFMKALSNVGKDLELTVLEDGIHIKSGTYTVLVPVGDKTQLRPTPPDASVAPMHEGFTKAMELAGRIVKDTATMYRDSVIYLNGFTVVSCVGNAVVEAWHGIDMPPGLKMPKKLATILSAIDALPVSFGVNFDPVEPTLTIYLNNGGFVRSQLYTEEYPAAVLQMMPGFCTAPTELGVPTGLFEAIAAVVPFVTDTQSAVYFTGGAVKAIPPKDAGDEWGASHDVKGLPDGVGTDGATLLKFADVAKTMWFGDPENEPCRITIKGDIFRAAIGGKPTPQHEAPPAPQTAAQPSTLPAPGQEPYLPGAPGWDVQRAVAAAEAAKAIATAPLPAWGASPLTDGAATPASAAVPQTIAPLAETPATGFTTTAFLSEVAADEGTFDPAAWLGTQSKT